MSTMPRRTPQEQDYGMLVHGRHLDAIGWEEMMWGNPERDRLGTLPTAVLSILDVEPERFKVVTIGTGASQRPDGTVEAAALQEFLLENYQELDEFDRIRNHPLWDAARLSVREMVEKAILDTASQNTQQEIANAADLFSMFNVKRVVEVTGASHAPRCQLVQSVARDAGVIPSSQRWSLVADDVPFPDTTISKTIVFEQPHRGDDPDRNLPEGLGVTDVFRKIFAVKGFERRVATLTAIDDVLKLATTSYDPED